MDDIYAEVCVERGRACLIEILDCLRQTHQESDDFSAAVTLELSPELNCFRVAEGSTDGRALNERTRLHLADDDLACLVEALRRSNNSGSATQLKRVLSRVIFCGADEGTLRPQTLLHLLTEWQRHVSASTASRNPVLLLGLRGCHIDEAIMSTIRSSFGANGGAKRLALDISCNSVQQLPRSQRADYVHDICELWEDHGMRHLSLAYCGLNLTEVLQSVEGGLNFIQNALRSLETLSLRGNNCLFGDGFPWVRRVAESLLSQPAPRINIRVLDVSRMELGDEAAEALCWLLEDPNCTIEVLAARRNNFTFVGLTHFAEAVVKNTSLVELYIGEQCGERSVGARAVEDDAVTAEALLRMLRAAALNMGSLATLDFSSTLSPRYLLSLEGSFLRRATTGIEWQKPPTSVPVLSPKRSFGPIVLAGANGSGGGVVVFSPSPLRRASSSAAASSQGSPPSTLPETSLYDALLKCAKLECLYLWNSKITGHDMSEFDVLLGRINKDRSKLNLPPLAIPPQPFDDAEGCTLSKLLRCSRDAKNSTAFIASPRARSGSDDRRGTAQTAEVLAAGGTAHSSSPSLTSFRGASAIVVAKDVSAPPPPIRNSSSNSPKAPGSSFKSTDGDDDFPAIARVESIMCDARELDGGATQSVRETGRLSAPRQQENAQNQIYSQEALRFVRHFSRFWLLALEEHTASLTSAYVASVNAAAVDAAREAAALVAQQKASLRQQEKLLQTEVALLAAQQKALRDRQIDLETEKKIVEAREISDAACIRHLQHKLSEAEGENSRRLSEEKRLQQELLLAEGENGRRLAETERLQSELDSFRGIRQELQNSLLAQQQLSAVNKHLQEQLAALDVEHRAARATIERFERGTRARAQDGNDEVARSTLLGALLQAAVSHTKHDSHADHMRSDEWSQEQQEHHVLRDEIIRLEQLLQHSVAERHVLASAVHSLAVQSNKNSAIAPSHFERERPATAAIAFARQTSADEPIVSSPRHNGVARVSSDDVLRLVAHPVRETEVARSPYRCDQQQRVASPSRNKDDEPSPAGGGRSSASRYFAPGARCSSSSDLSLNGLQGSPLAKDHSAFY